MMKRDILVVTDSHLTEHCPEWTVFRSLLEKISQGDYDVLFLGDIFDVWIGCKSYETGIHLEFMEWCRKEKKKRNLWFLEGNHEFFIRKNRSDCFTEVFSDAAVLDEGKLFATHGDMVNHHDGAYRMLRGILRNPLTYFFLRIFGLSGLGSSFTGEVRKDLKSTNQKQKRYYPAEELRDLSKSLEAKGVSCIVVGHFHRGGQEGIVTLLENFSQEDYMIAIYESGKGIRKISAKELIGERK